MVDSLFVRNGADGPEHLAHIPLELAYDLSEPFSHVRDDRDRTCSRAEYQARFGGTVAARARFQRSLQFGNERTCASGGRRIRSTKLLHDT